jgi:peroxiredoxin
MSSIAKPDWSTLPVPEDDGAARHLPGMRVPSVRLASTDGLLVDLASVAGRTVVFAYPRTGRPGEPNPAGWDAIPGARGCTPQACAFRDLFAELRSLGVGSVFGLSTQDSAYQREMAEREHLPFPILSDELLLLTRALRLPTFETHGMTLMKRLTLVIQDGVVEHIFYPIFPPDRNAAEVAAWRRSQASELQGAPKT